MDISLRPWSLNDIDSLAKNANNLDVTKYLRDVFPSPYSREDAKNFIEFCKNYEGEDLLYAIDLGGTSIGGANIGFRDDVNKKSVGIGYWIGKDYWGQGISTQVVKELCKIVFNSYDVVRIDAELVAENLASKKVLEKAGFSLEGTLRKSIYKGGKYYDSLIYSIIR